MPMCTALSVNCAPFANAATCCKALGIVIGNVAHIEWHGVKLHEPDWSEHSHALAFTFRSLRARFLLHGMINAFWEPLNFELPPVPAGSSQAWRRCIDTALASPDDFRQWAQAPSLAQSGYTVQPRSIVMCVLALSAAEESKLPR